MSDSVNYELVCPECGSYDIDMVGDPEYNDEWACNRCKEVFGTPKQIEEQV